MRDTLKKGEKLSGIYLGEDMELERFWEVVKEWQDINNKNIMKLEGEMKKLQEIISAIDLGILVIDKEGNIILANDEMDKFFDLNISNDKYYEKIKNMEIIKCVNRLLKENKIIEELYISSSRKTYILSGKNIFANDNYVVTLKDITKDKEFNKIQKRFITNISHELKTPLTNIKGYLIAAQEEEDFEMKNKFFDIINKNISKMENMLIDFLNISKLEHSKMLNVYMVNEQKLFENVESTLRSLIEEKKAVIEKEVKLKNSYGFMEIDFEKISVLLKNLVENAMIYNNKRPKIKISLTEEENNGYIIKVEDNGIGIPQGEIKNIFQRFYRIDKARTSNASGTGLGLAIVEEIVTLYNGKIEVESEENIGTKFKITIPKKK